MCGVAQCAYRLSQDGLATVIPHLTKQLLTVRTPPKWVEVRMRESQRGNGEERSARGQQAGDTPLDLALPSRGEVARVQEPSRRPLPRGSSTD